MQRDTAVTGPRPGADPTPADSAQRGPAAVLAAETDRLLACIHCGFCLDACPTYTRGGNESDSPRGRLYLMRGVAEGRVDPASDGFRIHLDRCLGCRACEPVCPSGVEYGFLLERGREAIAKASGISNLERLILAVFGNRSLNSASGFLARIIRSTGLARLAVRILPKRFRRARMAAAMLEASRPWKRLPVARPAGDSRTSSERGSSVLVFEGCVQKTLFSRVNAATEIVMQRNGHRILHAPRLGCCGALHAHAGELDGARALARANLEALEPFLAGENAVDAIIVNAAGCGAMMKDYVKLLEGRPGQALAEAVSSRVRDPLVFLAEHGSWKGGALRMRAAWDYPCHLLHGQRSGEAPLETLRAAAPGVEVVPVPGADECCGGAGIHALVQGDYVDRILSDKLAAVASVKADVVVTANPGCMMQIGAGLVLSGGAIRAVHPIELIAADSAEED